ncbi:hypothetical protein Bca4012_102569 [Brassica carinata]
MRELQRGSVKIRNRGVAPAHPGSGSAGGRVQRLEEHRASRGVGAFRALENPEDRVRSRPVVLITHQVSKVNSLCSNPSTVGGLLEPLTWRADRLVSAGADWERLFRELSGRRTANSELCSECQSEEIQPSAVRIRTVKAWPIDPLDLEFEARGVRKVTTGITGLWQPSVHSGVAFDPSMTALPINLKQN